MTWGGKTSERKYILRQLCSLGDLSHFEAIRARGRFKKRIRGRFQKFLVHKVWDIKSWGMKNV